MTRFAHVLVLFVWVATAACGDDVPLCEEHPDDPSCVADSGADSGGDTGVDGGDDGGDDDADTAVDAGPCGMPCDGATPFCNETSGMCVACLMDSDCSDPTAAKCDTTMGECVACDDSMQCDGIGSTNVCATAGDRAGECVECTDNSACGAMEGCDLAMNTCRTYTAESVGACGDCVADAECMAGMLCIPWTYNDPRTSGDDAIAAGNHCAWRQDASGMGAPEGDCFTLRPYIRAEMATSVDGVAQTFCTFRQSTCAAHADFSAVDCMTLDAAGDAMCGIDAVDDGVCRMAGATSNRCTVFCLSDDDCPAGSACDTGATPRVCLFM
jgi:hypothetical protein